MRFGIFDHLDLRLHFTKSAHAVRARDARSVEEGPGQAVGDLRCRSSKPRLSRTAAARSLKVLCPLLHDQFVQPEIGLAPGADHGDEVLGGAAGVAGDDGQAITQRELPRRSADVERVKRQAQPAAAVPHKAGSAHHTPPLAVRHCRRACGARLKMLIPRS